MELQLTDVKNSVRVLNFEEIKNELKEKLKPYTDYVVTEELLPQAKKDIAELNKTKKLLNDEKIRIERELLDPLKQDIKDLTALIDDSCKTIKTQVDNFEEERKDNKRKEIQGVFDKYNVIGLDISKIWNERWLNKGYSIKDIEKDIQAAFDKIEKDVNMIDDLNITEEDKKQVLTYYLFNLDLSSAINTYKENKANYEKYIERENKPQEEQKQETSTITLDTPQTVASEPKTSVKRYSVVLEFITDKDGMVLLDKFVKEHGIEHKTIQKPRLIKEKE